MLHRLLLTARTAAHLRWRQVAYRVVRRLQHQRPGPRAPYAGVNRAALPPLRAAMERWAAVQPPVDLSRARSLADGHFAFLEHPEHIPAIDWRRRYVSHLWSYNLHYFGYGVELALAHRATGEAGFARTFERLATGWIEGTRDGAGDGWQPYALSMRVVSWTYALLLFGDALAEEPRAALERSLFEQLDVLSRRLEWHVAANHLQKNLHALLVGSLLFAGPDAARWRSEALRQLARELDEQILPDGGHYERSPMYHALALGDLLEELLLLDAAGESAPRSVVAHATRMVAALHQLVHPDGSLHLLNDAAEGIATPAASLTALARVVLGEVAEKHDGPWGLPDTGYFGTRENAGRATLLVDCGEPGPSHQPGHAHCDLLSFELDQAGRPVVVDSGVHGYEGDPYRELARSTRAHNTVMIAGREQSEVWATFRMARRARVIRGSARSEQGEYIFTGAYRPYHDRGASHERELRYGAGRLIVTDRVDGAMGAPLESFLHLHPDFTAERSGDRVVARAGAMSVTIEPFGIDGLSLHRGEREPVQGWYCPRFGVAIANAVLVMRVDRNAGQPFGYRIDITSRPADHT